MDNATHSLTGYFLSRAGLNRFTPQATLILLLAANLPDLDIVTALGGSAAYLHWHRHLTHSLLAAPVLAFLVIALVRLWYAPFAWGKAFLVALAGVISHLLLDLTNIYGVRLMLPFSSQWFHWDITPVVDPWIWTAFLLCICGPLLSRLVSSEIGKARRAPSGRVAAILGLSFLLLYNEGRNILHNRVISILNSRNYEDSEAIRVAAFPEMANPWQWKGIAETAGDYHIIMLNAAQLRYPETSEIVRKADPSPAIHAALETYPFQVMREFAQYPVFQVLPSQEQGGLQVELFDLRFGFTSTALLDRHFQVEKSWFQFGNPSVH